MRSNWSHFSLKGSYGNSHSLYGYCRTVHDGVGGTSVNIRRRPIKRHRGPRPFAIRSYVAESVLTLVI